MTLSDKSCKSAKSSEKPYKMADGQGLYLEVMPNGKKYWRLKYRYLGTEKRLGFGVYPEVSLLEAREKRVIYRKLLAEGKNPASVRKEEKQVAKQNAATTFELVAR